MTIVKGNKWDKVYSQVRQHGKEAFDVIRDNLGTRSNKSFGHSVLDDMFVADRVEQKLQQKRQGFVKPQMEVPKNLEKFYVDTLAIERKRALINEIKRSARKKAQAEFKGKFSNFTPKKRGMYDDIPN